MIEGKTCFKCGQAKAISEFYKHSGMADGHLNKCKDCTKRDVSLNYSTHRDRFSQYDRERQKRPSRRAAKILYQNKHRKKHPDKYAARQSIGNAIRDGHIIRQPCVRCGNSKSQAHHHDYSQPFNVTWLCFKCHREHEHGQVVTSNSLT